MMLLEEKPQVKVGVVKQAAVTISFNVVALYLSHLITLELWRSMTGH